MCVCIYIYRTTIIQIFCMSTYYLPAILAKKKSTIYQKPNLVLPIPLKPEQHNN